MTKRLSDAIETVKFNWPTKDEPELISALEALIEHARIDAQAKTMEQIALEKLEYYKVDMEKVEQFMLDYKIDLDKQMVDIFKAKITGFLAAGGVIKEQ